MGLFPFPPVKRFCFCTRQLKCAAVTIIIVGMISSLHRVAVIYYPQCKNLYKHQNPTLVLLFIFFYLFFCSELLLLSSSFALLLSIFVKPLTMAADIYISCAVVTAILSIIFAIVQLIQGVIAGCGFQPEVLNFFVYFLMWTYFVFVMNTYRDEMTE